MDACAPVAVAVPLDGSLLLLLLPLLLVLSLRTTTLESDFMPGKATPNFGRAAVVLLVEAAVPRSADAADDDELVEATDATAADDADVADELPRHWPNFAAAGDEDDVLEGTAPPKLRTPVPVLPLPLLLLLLLLLVAPAPELVPELRLAAHDGRVVPVSGCFCAAGEDVLLLAGVVDFTLPPHRLATPLVLLADADGTAKDVLDANGVCFAAPAVLLAVAALPVPHRLAGGAGGAAGAGGSPASSSDALTAGCAASLFFLRKAMRSFKGSFEGSVSSITSQRGVAPVCQREL